MSRAPVGFYVVVMVVFVVVWTLQPAETWPGLGALVTGSTMVLDIFMLPADKPRERR